MASSKRIVIFGASSAIAIETARCFAKEGASFLLVGRRENALKDIAADLQTRGASECHFVVQDLADPRLHSKMFKEIDSIFPDYNVVFVAHGILGDQEECQKSYKKTYELLRVNLLGVISILTEVANRFEKQKSGQIGVITSVAGDRGRKSNYVYGTSKAALTVFLQGLRHRLAESNVQVLDVKPGFVDTPMTESMDKGPLFSSAQKVGCGIYSAFQKRKEVVYLPFFWRGIMMIICSIPEKMFKRTNI